MTTRRNFIKGILSGATGAFLGLAGSLRVGKEPYCPEATTPSPAKSKMASLRRAEQFWEERAWYWMSRSDEWRRSALEQQEEAEGWHRVAKVSFQHNNDLYEERIELLKELEEAIRERDVHAEVSNIWYMELRKDRDFTHDLITSKNVRIFELEEELEERDKRLAWLDIRLEAALLDKGA